MTKPKLAIYRCSSCGGCEDAIIDLAENFLNLFRSFDVVLWPIVLDFKYKHIEAMEDSSVNVSLINGAVRTSEDERMAKLLRQKSELVIAFGACSGHGGVPALANLTNRKKIFDVSFHNSPTLENPNHVEPKSKSISGDNRLSLPQFYETVLKLCDVIDVDYYIPGCPPSTQTISDALRAILNGKLPEKSGVLSPNRALCNSCERNESRPEDLEIGSFRRIIDCDLDTKKCFLTMGIVCMGPVTREGCGMACINGNMPCTGCYGPTDSLRDHGGKMIATLGGILKGDDESVAGEAIKNLVDPAGTFYRYTLSKSLLGSRRSEREK